MQLERIDCPVCGPGPTRDLFRVRDIKLFLPGEYPLVRCGSCGLGYLDPRPSPADIGSYYPAQYWSPPPPTGTQPYMDAGTRRALDLIARGYPGGRVLDVGCGVGVVAAVMRERGLDAVGLEPSAHAAQLARERYGLDVTCAVLQEADLPAGSFDAITMFDVLEHLHDPLGDLRRAHALLKPGGAVVVKAPNFGALQARVFGPWWYGLDAPRHLFHVTPRSLTRLLQTAGLADIRCRAVPSCVGALVFEISMVYWLRGRQLARRGVEVAPTANQTVGEALQGKVYAGVPSLGKRAFRWLVRNVLYAPLAVENLIGRSVELLAVARK